MKHAHGWLVLLATSAPLAAQELELAPLFRDGMVLQRELPIRLWGRCAPGARVDLAIANHRQATTAAADGRFDATLPALPAGGPHVLEVGGGGQAIKVRDVLIGEVWLASGQSNMVWEMRRVESYADAIAESADPRLRLFTVGRATADAPLDDCEGHWRDAEPASVAGFSAVGYWFGRALRAHLDVPVGVVVSAWGGTPAEAWTRRAPLERHLLLRPIVKAWDATDRSEPRPQNAPAALYCGMIAPLVPFTFRGVIWYQGESNALRAAQYATLFPTMIRDWREAFGQGDLPFLFVQLASWRRGGTAWAELREAQAAALRERGTGMAVAIDVGDADDIHPARKREVGERLALVARHVAYGETDVPWSGPRLTRMRLEGRRVRLHFAHADGLAGAAGDEVRGFEVAGADQHFVAARALVDGATVVVAAEDVPEPVAVRYAWTGDPDADLRNAAGLPAAPFRTDSWPGVTTGKLDPF